MEKGKKTETKKDKEISELTELLQRVQADFENYKKRIIQEKETLIKNSNKELIAEMLPVLDSFELALKNSKNYEDFKKGVEIIYSQFFALLEKNGLRPINAKGEKFNPYIHEALMQEEAEKPGIILEEFQKGYMLNDTVLRTSKVKVSKEVKNEPKNVSNNNPD